MAYVEPPFAITLGFAATNVAGNSTLVGAPGAGFRNRIVGLHFALRGVVVGTVDLVIQNGPGGSGLATVTLNVAGSNFADVTIPEPGIILDEDTALNIQRLASAAGPFNCFATAYFFVDDIS
jgi:hypothetical protein